jgi:outer membrane murein-binding lipoprotein Lpp
MRIIRTALLGGCLCAARVTGFSAEGDDLKRKVEELEKTVAELKHQMAATVPAGNPAVSTGGEEAMNDTALNDNQGPAARVDQDLTDAKYYGFFPIPNTPVIMKFNAKPHLDLTVDSTETGNDKRFVPARFPLEGVPTGTGNPVPSGGGVQSSMNANATQLSFDVRAPSKEGNLRFYYQNDFFGSDTKDMQFRVQHLYGTIYGFLGGYTFSAWEDPDSWPDTVDYEGPNAVIFARRPVAHYKNKLGEHWNYTVGLEAPRHALDLASDPSTGALATTGRERFPDLTMNTRYEKSGFGHVQISGILRELGAESKTGQEYREVAWGLNVGAGIELGKNNTIQGLAVYGVGVGGLGNDTSFENADAAFDATGDLVALPYTSLMLALTHRWNEDFRSTATLGYVFLDSDEAAATFLYETSQYASVNLIWQLRQRLSVGAEVLYGYREAQDVVSSTVVVGGAGADSGAVVRFQIGMVYSIF